MRNIPVQACRFVPDDPFSMQMNAQADALRNGWPMSAMPEISTGHLHHS